MAALTQSNLLGKTLKHIVHLYIEFILRFTEILHIHYVG